MGVTSTLTCPERRTPASALHPSSPMRLRLSPKQANRCGAAEPGWAQLEHISPLNLPYISLYISPIGALT